MPNDLTTNHTLLFKNSNSMEAIENESIDLVITSPPYPMIEMWDNLFSTINPEIKKKLDKDDGISAFNLMHEELNKTWSEVGRILKQGGITCINIGDATRKIGNEFRLFSNHSKIINQFEDMGFSVLPEILWRKQSNKPNKFMGSGMLPTSAYVTQEHEYILIFRKGEPRSFKPKDEFRYKSAFFWEERNVWFSDIWLDLKGIPQKLEKNDLRKRSGAYPFELAYRLINMYSVLGDTVLDPFLGTGTTMFAAMASGRNSIGYEIEPKFNNLIDNRIKTIREFANDYNKDRINNHVKFIKNRESKDKESNYIAENYGFKVITKQEIGIIFHKIIEIKPFEDDFGYEVKYKELSKENLEIKKE